ncbi:autotransporter domain-containing protein [Phyllobacterium sp. SB3]|uniref:autotransporter domain-containing protein n=1 Tax=Phyllobacterium sp. SB3 TaxID=3156073 RepID=UPI0032AFC832
MKIVLSNASNLLHSSDRQVPYATSQKSNQLKLWKAAKLASIAGFACFGLSPIAMAQQAVVSPMVGVSGTTGEPGEHSHDENMEYGGTGENGGVGGAGLIIQPSTGQTYSGIVIGGDGGTGGNGGNKYDYHDHNGPVDVNAHKHGGGGYGGIGGMGGTGILGDSDTFVFSGTATGGAGGKGGAGGEGLIVEDEHHDEEHEGDEPADHEPIPPASGSAAPVVKQYTSAEEHNGGTGGRGGLGGDGIIVKNLENEGTIIGGQGGAGGDAGHGDSGIGIHGHGGDGGTGADVVQLTNKGTINGGAGGSGEGHPENGYGGKGGTGVIGRNGSVIVNNGDISGGMTGKSGRNGTSGDGGIGLVALSGTNITNNGTIMGGYGGAVGGRGAAGVSFAGTLINNGTIGGGDGGSIRGKFKLSSGVEITPTDSVGVHVGDGSGSILTNNGTITGGLGKGNERGTAVQFSEKAVNGALVLHAKSNIIGNVIANKSIVLKLGGTEAATFNVAQIGDNAQYRGFGFFDKIDPGTWTLQGSTTAVTPWVVSGGILAVSSDESFGDLGGIVILNGGKLLTTVAIETSRLFSATTAVGRIQNDAALTLKGGFVGQGSLIKSGQGRLTIAGAGTYPGETTVEEGELAIAKSGSLVSPITVNSLARLIVDGSAAAATLNSGSHISGSGTLVSLHAKSGSIVSPGNSVGTLRVSKDVTFEQGSTFNVEIKSNLGSADRLAISGQAMLLGGVVNVRLENDTALLTEDVTKSLFLKTFDILTTGKGVTGQFDGVWPRYNYITANLDYTDKNTVVLGFDFTTGVKTAEIVKLETQLAAVQAEKKLLIDAEAKRIANAAEAAHLAEETEKQRLADQKAEEDRIAAVKAADDLKLAEEAEQKKLADLAAAEAKKLADQKAEEERIVAAKAADDLKLAEEAEQKKLADLAAAEAKKLADQKAEEDHIAAVKAADDLKLAEEAEQKKLADLAAAEAKKLADQKTEEDHIAAIKAADDLKLAEEAEQKKLADLAAAEAKKIADQKAEEERIAAAKAADDLKLAEEAEQKKLADLAAAEAKKIADQKAEEDRIAAENKRLADLVATEATLQGDLHKARMKTLLLAEYLPVGVQSRNQTSVWRGIQSLGLANEDLLNQVAGSSSDNPLDFDTLSGEVHASLSGVLAADSHFISDAATSRVRNAFGGVTGKAQAVTTPLAYGPESKAKHSDAFAPVEPAAATTAFWGEAYGSWAHADGDGNASGYSRNTGGLVTGFDGIVADDWRFGLLAGYGSTSLQTGYGKASVDSYQVGVYGGTKLDALGLRLGVNLGQHEIDTKRTARFGSLNNEHEASYDAQTVQVFGELGYEINTAYAALEPFAAARHVHVKTNSFNEDGAFSNLSGEGSSTDLTITTLGLRAAHQFTLSESMTLTARGMLGWTHGFGDMTPEASLALNSSAGFTVEGAGIAKDAAIIEAGFDIGIGRATSIGLSYTGQFSSQSHDNAIKADLSVRF